MIIDKKQIVNDLLLAHKEALVQAETDLSRYNYQPPVGQECNFYKAQKSATETLNHLHKLIKTYESLKQTVPGKLSRAQVGSVVVVRMGINNEMRSYFIHDGLLIDPRQWNLRSPSASMVRLGDLNTFGGLRVGDTYTSDEGRAGDEVKSKNHVIDIL